MAHRSSMNPMWLIFLSLLTSVGTPRKHIPPSEELFRFVDYPKVPLPINHLEEDEEEDGTEENSNDEHSEEIAASPSVSNLYETQDVLKKTAQHLQEYSKSISIKRAEEEQKAVESRFGPHYLNVLRQSFSKEKFQDVSNENDLLKRKTTQETSQEDFTVNVTLAVSSVTLAFSLIMIVCCGVAFYKHRRQKVHSSNTQRSSPEQQRTTFPSFFYPLKRVSDSSVSRTAESKIRSETTASDVWNGSHSDSSKPKTLPFINSMDDVSSISAESSHSSTPSYKAFNADQI